MKILHGLAWLVAIVAVGLVFYILAAPAAEDPYTVYREHLTRVAELQPPVAGSAEEVAALERFEHYVTGLTASNIRRNTTKVYAPDAILSDTLAVVSGADAIEAYFLHSAESGVSVGVDVEDIVRSGDDYYVRWTMRIATPKLRGGESLTSAGMTHLRLASDGRVVLHYDFWDSAHGLFNHLPGAGGLLQRIRQRMQRAQAAD